MNTTEPMPALLEAYFADLDRALIGADPRERAETVQAMREDAAEMLAQEGASEKTAERIVVEFGPVEQVAAAATPAPAPGPGPTRSWADIWLLVGSIAGFVYWMLPFIAIAMLIWAVLRMRRNTGNRILQRVALWVSIAAVAFSVGLFIMHSVSSLLGMS
ncbi:hypothetical protein NNX28_16280 [Arthrobacter sp. zg-Y859]|uniref:DUF4190 domain-containing protein n=1 Tax=Arthrobacter jinronghuae TaxID=2964609 RepID=A0ABT1NUZ9_9MICC|nr:hypothetical protein [Arthrobacter jinronghuae]MCQ1951480.1 hypothetical protein [Arthrobacter jinronghuae]UWX78880.1 hypothetical protein N2K98_01280 [Arthrobacter jinronghuae]